MPLPKLSKLLETVWNRGLQMIHLPDRQEGGVVDQHVVSITNTESYDAEQYRKLRYVLEEKHNSGGGMVVGICSPASGDGKSLTAINLATALAEAANVKVLLIDADLRRGSASLKTFLGLWGARMAGLANAIVNPDINLQDVAKQVIMPNLAVIFSGNDIAKPYELLRSARFGQLMKEARRLYDYVIIDTPPVVPVPDCQVMARQIDIFLMVVAAHRTPRNMLEEALNVMNPEKLIGLVFNNSDPMPSRYYGYYRYEVSTARNRIRTSLGHHDISVSLPEEKKKPSDRGPDWNRQSLSRQDRNL